MRAVFQLGLWFAPNNIQHVKIIIDDPAITDIGEAMWLVVDWQMEMGRQVKGGPKNVTSLTILED